MSYVTTQCLAFCLSSSVVIAGCAEAPNETTRTESTICGWSITFDINVYIYTHTHRTRCTVCSSISLVHFFFPPFFYYYYSHLSIRWWRLLYDRLPFNCYWTDALLAFAWKHASIRQATCKRYMFFSSGCDADAQASLILCVCVCTLVGYHTIISFIRRFFDPLPYLDALISAPSISRASVFFDTLFFLLPGLD